MEDEFAKYLIIENENSSGQGFNPHHSENPHHAVLTDLGWKYSHTTRIGAPDGSKFASHTYVFPGTDWAVGVNCRPGYLADAGRIGSGHRCGYHAHGLKKYLKRKTAELNRAFRKMYASK